MNTPPEDITVLGGGPAGLCVGYHAKKAGINFIILEATAAVGGNGSRAALNAAEAPAAAVKNNDEGCGCRAADSHDRGRPWWAFGIAAMMAVLRRRREGVILPNGEAPDPGRR